MFTLSPNKLPELTQPQKDFLTRTAIDETEPGAIVRDFQTVLNFVNETNPALTGTLKFSTRTLNTLNELMVVPLAHRLNRPQQKSFPHLNGLYLLLRASGLSYVESTGKKPTLVIDESVAVSWSGLNLAECYFTLLETWLLRASPEILGERGGMAFSMLIQWLKFFEKIPDEGLQAAADDNLLEHFRYWPGSYNMALMELFGLVEITKGEPIEGEGWSIAQITRTALGDALLVLLDRSSANMDDFFLFENYTPPPNGELQPVIQPYFPEWQKNLAIPQSGQREGSFIFTVALGKDLWRRIAIPHHNTLEDLSNEILAAYEFDHDHLYEFIYADHSGISQRAFHPYMEESPTTHEVKIGTLPLREGATMVYHYDFGDDWRFDVMLEKVDVENKEITKPILLEKHGEAPQQYSDYDDDGW